MSDSILNDTKKVLSIGADDTAFDVDIVMHINSTFTILSQLGVGPANGFMIEDAAAQWVDYLHDDLMLNSVKSYIYLRVRLLFDPPATSHLVAAIKEQIAEIEWRLNVEMEGRVPLANVPPVVIVPTPNVIDTVEEVKEVIDEYISENPSLSLIYQNSKV